MKVCAVFILTALSFVVTANALIQPTNAPSATASNAPAANPAPPPSEPAKRSAAELEKLAMPIALHPDPLISVILPASAYPLEIVQAARFVKDTNNITKLDTQSWDDNVKEVAKFPQLIEMMNTNLSWTIELGDAFVNQPKDLMDTIQSLRAKAKNAGTLQTTPQQIVTVTNIVVQQTNVTEVVNVTKEVVQVVPANPSVVYVPTYSTAVYYPPPAYVYNPIAPLVTFGVGMAAGAILANNCNWGYGHVDIDVDRDINRNVDRNVNRSANRNTSTSQNRNRTANTSGQRQWSPDTSRRQQSGATRASADARGWGSGGARPSTGTVGSRPTTGTAGSRPTGGTVGSRPTTGTGTRPSAPANRPSAAPASRPSAASRPAAAPASRPSAPASRPAAAPQRSSSGSAFNQGGGGSNARSYSSRGAASRGGGARGGGRGGGRR